FGMSAKDMLIKNAPRTIKFATGENVTQANRCGAEGDRFPNTRMGVEETFIEAFLDGQAYTEKLEAYETATRNGIDAVPPRRDLRLEALSGVAKGEIAIHAHCYRSDEILRLLAVAEEFNVRVGTLHHVLEGYRIMPEIARHGCGASTFSNLWAYKMEAYGAIPHNASMMSNAGICSTINSDSPNTIRFLGQEAAKSIRWGGLSETDALKLVTLNAATQLQLDDRIGSLEIGKDGDLAIFNGHPLNTFARNVMTVIDGEVFFQDKDRTPIEPCATVRHPGKVNFSIPETVHRAYAITGATVHPISSPAIENGTVVIIDERIHAVGDSSTEIPPGAGKIDGSGLHVYPGLIDAGNTVGLEEIGSIRATRDAREIAEFSPQLTASSAMHTHSAHIRIARSTGTTTILTKPKGERIAGQSTLAHLNGWTMPEMLIQERLALHMSVPTLPIRLPTDAKRKKRIVERQEKAMKRLNDFLDEARHYAKVMALENVDAADLERIRALEAMAPFLAGKKPVIFNANGVKEILDTITFARKHGFKPIISGGREAWKIADRLAKEDIPVIIGTPLSLPRGTFEPWDSVYRSASVLDQAGVRFCFASESYAHAYDLGTMAGMTVAFGLPRERAERALTLGAAEMLGINEDYGSLEPGKMADVIVMTDSPLQTASVLTHMFIKGKPVALSSLHTENRDKFAGRPSPDLGPAPTLVGPPDMTTR
ncbi:MAG: amidohydrolase family protein, partial [Phycisphaerae bacterium]